MAFIDSSFIDYPEGAFDAPIGPNYCGAKPFGGVRARERAVDHNWEVPENGGETLFCCYCGAVAYWKSKEDESRWRALQRISPLSQRTGSKVRNQFEQFFRQTFDPFGLLIANGEKSMKAWVKLHKDGEHMGIETNCADERAFWAEFCRVLADAVENKFLGQAEEQFARWLPQAFDVVAHLRGYKTSAVVEHIVKVGEVYSGTQDIYTSEKPLLKLIQKNEVG